MPTRRVLTYVLSASFVAVSCIAHAAIAPMVSHCVLQSEADHFTGACGEIFGQTPTVTLKPAAAVTTGMWRADIHPSTVWAGDMTNDGHRNARLELEVYPDGGGVLRTQNGWFPISHFAAATDTLTFDLDTSHEVPPSPLDKQILRTTAQLLTPATWNRVDALACPANATTWSFFCAMMKVTADITGGSNNHRPAFQIVRRILAQRTAAHDYPDRFIGYNNDPATTLADVQSLFTEALAQADELSHPLGSPSTASKR